MIVGAISLVFGVVLFLLPTMAELTGRYVIEHAAPAPPAGAPVPDSRPEPPVPSATAIKAILKAELREALPSMSASLQLSRRPEHPFPTAKWRQLGDDLASVDPAAHETFARAYGVVAYINGNVLYDGMREALSGAEYDALEEGEGVVRSVVEGV